MGALLTPEARSESLIEALPHIQEFRGHTFVLKYGGAAMEDDQIVEKFLRDVVFLEAVGINPVLVHGGGKAITARMREAGLKAQFVNGLRITDSTAIRIVEETLDGEINPSIVRTLEEFGGRAAGFSGKAVFQARFLPPQTGEAGELVEIGFVGEAARMNAKEIKAAIRKEIVPVISPIGAAEDGTVLNINADVAAAALAAELKATKLIFVSDVPGIMRDQDDKSSLIPSVTAGQVETLIKQKVIAGGMIPKVQSAAAALRKGVEKIHLIGGQIQHCLLLEIFTDAGIGTEILP
ncbi:MAG: acetylglutamate kinase [Terrimicrobiaceae bacterium]|jgi:acetylglutamate kinase|nr:acetylglutamate kinase [Terrimicrobiaceae bacterium]